MECWHFKPKIHADFSKASTLSFSVLVAVLLVRVALVCTYEFGSTDPVFFVQVISGFAHIYC